MQQLKAELRRRGVTLTGKKANLIERWSELLHSQQWNGKIVMTRFYKKRSGTSGISGHLYETKLIALILFRLLHDDHVEDFCLASNVDEIGAFDDVCFKIKIKGRDQLVAIFIQVKHKENDDKFPTFDNKSESVKWFESLTKIKKKITLSKNINNQDNFFSGDIAESGCVFVLYTNAKCDFDSNNAFVSDYDEILNYLIATSSTVGTLPVYTEQHVEAFGQIILKEDIMLLAEHFSNSLNVNRSMNLMNDEYVKQYHVILKQDVVNISDVQPDKQKPDEKGRTLTFQDNFFDSQNEYVKLFRDHLFREILNNQPELRNYCKAEDKISQDLATSKEPYVSELISLFLSNPSADTLTPLVITHIACNENGKLEFLCKRPLNDVEQLREINIPRELIDEAVLAARTVVVHFLRSLKLKVPITFGNADLTIIANPKKYERRLKYLTTEVIKICERNTQKGPNKIVIIDDTIDGGFLDLNGGLAGAVGNLLIYDEETKMLKFSFDLTPEQKNAKALFEKLVDKINKLDEYRFDIRTIKFPKLHFDCINVARGFLNKLVIFSKQKNHSEVEEILKKSIENRLSINPHTFSIKSDTVFLHYHNEIQKWWMAPKIGTYLTKTDNLDEQAINNIVTEPQISALQIMFYMSNLRCFRYSFNEDATVWIKQPKVLSKMFVVTDTVKLTCVKVIQSLRGHILTKKYAVLDLACIFDLPAADFNSLNAELIETDKVIIIVWHNTRNDKIPHFKLYEFAQAMKQKQLIIITNSAYMNVLNECFAGVEVLNDETQTLKALTTESQKEVTKYAAVLFQGQEVSLDLLMDDVSIGFIKGSVLEKVISNERISIATTPLSNDNYEEIKHLYIDRSVRQVDEDAVKAYVNHVRSFHDIADDAVLVTATPGMGKSTLLTHLSLKTKELDVQFWIVRINLLNHAKQFYKWQQSKMLVDTSETLKFLCQVISNTNDISIYFQNNEVHLRSCEGDVLSNFEINLFLHFYNKRKLIFLFDGFDEICPHYKDTVINFLNVVRNSPQKNKMWVTSRPCSGVNILQRHFGKCFKLEHLNLTEQQSYLETIWREKMIFDKFDDTQHRNLKMFLNDIYDNFNGKSFGYTVHAWIRIILLRFYDFVRSNNNFIDLSQHDTNLLFNIDEAYYESEEVETLSGTPLLLYFVADYTVNVKDNYKHREAAYVSFINILNIYESFVENKLKKLFQDKNNMDLYNPDVIMKYEKEIADCISLHKKIAAYIIFYLQPPFDGFDFLQPMYSNLDVFRYMGPFYEGGEEEFTDLVNKIKGGTEKIGLISHISLDGIPVFIHKTFLEYFASEYICDVLKSGKFHFDEKKKWLHAIADFCDDNVFIWVHLRSKLDDELTIIIREIGPTESFMLSLI